MKLKMSILSLILVSLILFSACSKNKLDEAFDEEKLKDKSIEIIDLLYNGEFEKIEEISIDELKTELTKELKDQIVVDMKTLGDFKNHEKFDYLGSKIKSGESIDSVIVISNFEKHQVKFTITYNVNMELAGIYYNIKK